MTQPDPLRPGRATLADVARLAGVSLATASKALNGRDQVRAETRRRVTAAAAQLQFSPNAMARTLVSGRSHIVGLVTHDLEGRFSIPILMGTEDAAGNDRISVLLCDARGDSLRERHHIETLLARRVDGLILAGARLALATGLNMLGDHVGVLNHHPLFGGQAYQNFALLALVLAGDDNDRIALFDV